jgi:hypothetical protein
MDMGGPVQFMIIMYLVGLLCLSVERETHAWTWEGGVESVGQATASPAQKCVKRY